MSDVEYHYSEARGPELVLSRGAERHWPRHLHLEHRVVGLVLAGLAILEAGGSSRRLDVGATFTVAPGVVHSLRLPAGGSLAVLCIPVESSAAFSPRESEAPAGNPLQAVARLLAEHPEHDLSVADMAALAGCSSRHLLRRFQAEIGLTPHAFQLGCRLRKVRLLLRSGIPAAEAAASAGFSDQSHMHKVFKERHGLTPREFVRAGRLLFIGGAPPLQTSPQGD